MGPNVGSKQQTTARLFGCDAEAFAAFDPTTEMSIHGPYTGVAGWFAVGGSVPTVYHAPGVSPPDGHTSVNEEDHQAVANNLFAGQRCGHRVRSRRTARRPRLRHRC
ncbi:MAG TPA: hypothetical protein VE666_13735 [Mycobacterium sp.]|jgi:hypothetical protein|nr:hypothetical protein [Mycobacterium sp.]